MDEVARLLTLLALLGGALTLLGGACVWFLDEGRRIRRTLGQALGATPQPMLVARGRGVGIGFDLTRNLLAVTWDRGGWQLTYRLDELTGVELILDRQVAARAFRGEPRRALDQLIDPEERVRLRFVFDDPAHPDFEMDLWIPGDEARRGRLDAGEALHEANRWMARMESLLRRPVAKPTPPAVQPAPTQQSPPAPRQQPPLQQPVGPLFGDEAFEDDAEDAIR
ncbi:MAG: hypothetical protein EPO51_22860 [Phenylobacterium sp.]|uniref:hypothetical protein n=1 Tax=Phenylobacterium sp. TaxID=1871053 RepID=UPI00120FC02A|nr:hypothetical protein [Phenylobacterium sp.]TAJ69561.1 MAG: hypothetical protein EPO51_22860 [Phenylobacterium sp.]